MKGGISDLRESSQTANQTKETRPGADPWGMGTRKKFKRPTYDKDQQAQMTMQRLQNAKDSLSSTMSQVNSRLSQDGYADGGIVEPDWSDPDVQAQILRADQMGTSPKTRELLASSNAVIQKARYLRARRTGVPPSVLNAQKDRYFDPSRPYFDDTAQAYVRRSLPAGEPQSDPASKAEVDRYAGLLMTRNIPNHDDNEYADGGMVYQKPGVQSGPLGGLAYWRPTTAVNPNGGAASAPQQGTPNVFANTPMPQQTYGGNPGWHPQMAPVNYAPLPSRPAGNGGGAGGGGAPQSGAGASPSAIMQYLTGAQTAAQPTNYGFANPGGVPALSGGPAPTQPLPGQSVASTAFPDNPYRAMALTGAIDPRQFQGYASGGYVNVGYNAAAPDFWQGGLTHGARRPPPVPKPPTTGPGGGSKGFVRGPGTGTSDSVRAPRLSNGEFVFTNKAVRGAKNLARRMGDNSPMGGPRLLYQSMMNLERAASRG